LARKAVKLIFDLAVLTFHSLSNFLKGTTMTSDLFIGGDGPVKPPPPPPQGAARRKKKSKK